VVDHRRGGARREDDKSAETTLLGKSSTRSGTPGGVVGRVVSAKSDGVRFVGRLASASDLVLREVDRDSGRSACLKGDDAVGDRDVQRLVVGINSRRSPTLPYELRTRRGGSVVVEFERGRPCGGDDDTIDAARLGADDDVGSTRARGNGGGLLPTVRLKFREICHYQLSPR